MVCQQGLKITEELVQRVEVVYVLGLFLLGKHRKKVSHSFHIVFNQNLIETCCDATCEFPQHVFFDCETVIDLVRTLNRLFKLYAYIFDESRFLQPYKTSQTTDIIYH